MFLNKLVGYLKYGKIVAKVLDAKGIKVKGVPVGKIESAIEKALTGADTVEDVVRGTVIDVKTELKKG